MQLGDEYLLDVGFKGRAVHRAVQYHRRDGGFPCDGRNQRGCIPVPVGGVIEYPLAFLRATVKPDQLAAVEAKISSAMSEARSASSTAKNALAAATAASEAAAKAQATADDALSCCNDNKNRIERMFEQTMKK